MLSAGGGAPTSTARGSPSQVGGNVPEMVYMTGVGPASIWWCESPPSKARQAVEVLLDPPPSRAMLPAAEDLGRYRRFQRSSSLAGPPLAHCRGAGDQGFRMQP